MANVRRLTFNPPLTEAEFVGFCADNRGLKIVRDPSGVIAVRLKSKGRGNYCKWLLPAAGTISSEAGPGGREASSTETEIHDFPDDLELLQALEALEGRLIRKKEHAKGAHATALNVAIRALLSHGDILGSLIAHEQRMPPKVTSRDMDTYDQRRAFLTDSGQPIDGAVKGDPAERTIIERARIRVVVENNLIKSAQSYTGIKERSVLIRTALKQLVQREAAKRLVALGGTAPHFKAVPRRRFPGK